ncbi:MAG: EthD domain-containing protein [Pseudomonadota bacterium]
MTLKLNIVGRRRPGTTLTEHRYHIRQVHGAAVLRFIEAEPDNAPRRYVQNAVFDGQYRAAAPGSDPFALNRDFVTQIWCDDLAMLERSRRSAFYQEQLKEDEDRFVDQASVLFLPSREREIVARAAIPAGAVKLFTFTQRAPGAHPAEYASAWRQAAQAAGAAPLRHVQNDLMSPPGTVQFADAIDEFWLPDEASARALLASWSAVLTDALVRPGLASAASVVSLLAREDVVYPGAANLSRVGL